ncbi:hypothetical protein ANO11243_046590 [Dothideomycetidae sp. 11243]|nr:hypothetical protein ANO11243_046590 [fungal sp. No.11243]
MRSPEKHRPCRSAAVGARRNEEKRTSRWDFTQGSSRERPERIGVQKNADKVLKEAVWVGWIEIVTSAQLEVGERGSFGAERNLPNGEEHRPYPVLPLSLFIFNNASHTTRCQVIDLDQISQGSTLAISLHLQGNTRMTHGGERTLNTRKCGNHIILTSGREAWRYTGPFTRFQRFRGAFPGLGIATVAFAGYLAYEAVFLKDDHAHGHEDSHGGGHH